MPSPLLIRTIDDELRWRESELALAKINLHRAIGDRKSFGFAYRCFVAMTCAHYEGFVKKVIAQAVDDLSMKSIPLSDFNTTINIHVIAPRIRKTIESKSNEIIISIIDNRSELSKHIGKIFDPSKITKKGNLDYDTFCELISIIGIDNNKFLEYKNYINKLVYSRHECAHGELLTFDSTKSDREISRDIFHTQNQIISLLHALSIELIDHFSNSAYLCAGTKSKFPA